MNTPLKAPQVDLPHDGYYAYDDHFYLPYSGGWTLHQYAAGFILTAGLYQIVAMCGTHDDGEVVCLGSKAGYVHVTPEVRVQIIDGNITEAFNKALRQCWESLEAQR